MNRQNQTKVDKELSEPTAVEVDWINFRSDKGRSDYGDHRCSVSVDSDEVNYLRSLVSRCHSDTDPAPEEDQYYFFKLSSTERRRWVMMRSQNNLDLMALGERKGRVFNAVIMSDDDMQRALPDGNPLLLLPSAIFDEIDLRANDLANHDGCDGDYRAQGPILRIPAKYSYIQKKLVPTTPQSIPYEPDSHKQLFEQIKRNCEEGVQPTTFATWWSSLRPLPDRNPFMYVFVSPQPKQLIERGEALSKALSLNQTVQQIYVPDELGKQALHLWSDITRLTENLYVELNNIFNTASKDRSVWTDGWPRICGKPTIIAQKLMSLGDKMIGTDHSRGYELVCETAENYQKLAGELRSVRPPKLDPNSFTPSDVLSTPNSRQPFPNWLKVLQSISRTQWIVIGSLVLLFGTSLYIGTRFILSGGSTVATWSGRDKVFDDVSDICDEKINDFTEQNQIYSGRIKTKESKKLELEKYVRKVILDTVPSKYSSRRSEVSSIFQKDIDTTFTLQKKRELERKRDQKIRTELNSLSADLFSHFKDKFLHNFDNKFIPTPEPGPEPAGHKNATKLSKSDHGSSESSHTGRVVKPKSKTKPKNLFSDR